MQEIETELSDIYLNPGESYLARKPAIIRTILGSCVGVAFWSARLGVGALTHSQLPRCPAHSTATVDRATGLRYVDFAIREIARQFDELGVRRSELEVKLFGGADVLVVSEGGSSKPTVGRLNCEAAIEVAEAERLNVVASSLGGAAGLNLRFDTRTGEVRLRRLS
jgi:chemotaxis protein CheD